MYDRDFLKKLDNVKGRETYARITALNWQEEPLEYIEGRVTNGSVSIDGNSAVRRACSLTMIADEVNINDFYWGLNSKFILEIGMKNTIDSNYPDIIWFKQGMFIITSFSTSISNNAYTININGKDKMCLLNGDVSGSLPMSVDFGVEEYTDESGNVWENDIPIVEIIRNAVQVYGQELPQNIIINDVDDSGLFLLESHNADDFYMIYHKDSAQVANVFLDSSVTCYVDGEKTTIGNIGQYYTLNELSQNNTSATQVTFSQDSTTIYYVIKVSYGDLCGYRLTDLTYSGDLIGSVGESLTSILDKIKTMLGSYEYYYDIDGRFIFQKKPQYIDVPWTGISSTDDGEAYVKDQTEDTSYSYYFGDSQLIASFSNSPNILNIRNDFAIWGEKENKNLVHLRYGIGKKPTKYTTIEITAADAKALIAAYPDIYAKDYTSYVQSSQTYVASEDLQDEDESYIVCDWREIIYQMSEDYYKFYHSDEFLLKVADANMDLYPLGTTGYEQYYMDFQGFWRSLYCGDVEPAEISKNTITTATVDNYYYCQDGVFYSIDSDNYRLKVYLNDSTQKKLGIIVTNNQNVESVTEVQDLDTISMNLLSSEKYYLLSSDNKELCCRRDYFLFAPEDIKNLGYTGSDNTIHHLTTDEYTLGDTIVLDDDIRDYDFYNRYLYTLNGHYDIADFDVFNSHWNYAVNDDPASLLFWFDLLDTGGDICKFSIPAIGDRTKAVKESDIKAIYYGGVPTIIYETEDSDKYAPKTGYIYVTLPDYAQELLYVSSKSVSCMDKLNDMLYDYTYANESISVTALPIYYLEPNTKIMVRDDKSGIDGEYIITRINLQLNYSGTMSITASKAVDKII